MSHSPLTGRLLFVFCSVFFISSLIFAHTHTTAMIISTAFAAFTLVFCIPFIIRCRSKHRIIPLLICTSVILSCVVTYFSVTAKITSANALDGTTVKGNVTVLDVEYTSEYASAYTVRFTKSEQKITGKLSLTVEERSLSRGDVLNGTFTVSTPHDDEKTEYYKNGVFLTAEAEDISYAGRDGKFSLSSFFHSINEDLCRTLNREGKGRLASAVLLGDRGGLDTAVKRDFSRLGIYHLLALSGLHLSVLVSALGTVLEKTKLKPLQRNGLKIMAILLYMALTGFSVSVARAGIMHLAAILASCIDRDADSLTSLSAAAVLILLFDPAAVFDSGLLLSVLAAYGCITMASLTDNRLPAGAPLTTKVLRYACSIFLLTVLINLITLPVTWVIFGEISLISPIVNVLFIPAVTMLLILSSLSLLLSPVPILSDISFASLYFAEDIIIKSASAVSQLHGITVTLRHTGTGIFILLLFLSLLPLAFVGKRLRKYLAVTSLICLLGIISTTTVGYTVWRNSCDVQYTVSGISDAIVLRDGNQYTVIDVTEGTRSMARTVTDTVKKNKGGEIDTLILTHYDVGHISSVPYLADRMIVRRVLLPKPETENETDLHERIIASLTERNVPVTVYRRDVKHSFSEGRLHVEFLPVSFFEYSSHPVITLNFTLGDINYAYGGGALSYSSSEFTPVVEKADTLILGAHPPIGDGFFLPSVTGKIVIPKQMMTDELLRRISAASEIIPIENKEIYSTGTYTPK